MKKLLIFFPFYFCLLTSAFAQVPARSTPVTCVRDDALTTVPQSEGSQTPCRIDSVGNIWVNLGTRLDQSNDAIAIYGSDDAGTTKRIIKTDSGGAVQVDCESGCGGGTQYDQGTVAGDTDKLTMAGAVRKDTAAIATGVADGDNTRLSTDSAGRLRTTSEDITQPISAASLPLPTGAATSANQDGIIRDGTGDTTQANVSSGRLHVDGSGVTQPVSGSVTANAGSNLNTSALALDATLTGRLPAGASPADNETNTNTNLSRVGNYNFVFDGTAWDRLPGTSADGVLVNLGTNNDVTVTSGSITANAGTNLNTSALLTTSAHDAAFGTAGSADAQVRTIQGVASMTPVTINGANANAKINCTNNAFLNMSTATTTEIVALSGSTIIYVCSFSIVSNGGTATNIKFVGGTGTNCATSQDDRSGNMPFTAAANTVGISRGSGEGMIIKTSTAGDALCVTSSGAATVAIDVSYAQF